MSTSEETGAPSAARPSKEGPADRFTSKGISIEFSVRPEKGGGETPPLREGNFAEVRFKVTDAATGAPVTPLKPAVWIDLVKEEGEEGAQPGPSCRDKIALHLQGGISFQADIDLNKFYMLVMNNDHTISVVDPILGITGITQLYAMILLKDTGEDWVMSPEGKLLYVSLPRAGLVAVADLETFKVIQNIKVGGTPVRVALQPDGRYLWVGNDAAGEGSGVTVVDTRTREVVARIPTGAGHHEIAFSDDSLKAYVTNRDQDTLSVVDTQRLVKVRDLPTGKRPSAVQFSRLSKNAYVAAEGDGLLSIVDGGKNEVTKTLRFSPGTVFFRFAPGDRWGFATNPRDNVLHVLDASGDVLAHSIKVGIQPHQVAFTDTFAYVRSLGTADIHLIPLAQLGSKQSPAPQTVHLGSSPPGNYKFPSVADSISPTGEWDTVLVANPADGTVSYYMEGMVAPMGTFPTYGRVPRAVRVVDRSLRETEKGVYAGKLRIPRSGTYEVAFLLDSPWVYNCFEFAAEPNPALGHNRKNAPPRVELLSPESGIAVGKDYAFRFSLKHPFEEKGFSRVEEVTLLLSRPPGTWQRRITARPDEKGIYEARLTPDTPGVYQVFLAIPSMNLGYHDLPNVFLKTADSLER